MDLKHIPLNKLKIATLNVRHGRKAPDVSDILPSIRARGVLQPVLVRPCGEGFEVVAGRRRYFAANQAAEEQGLSPDEAMLPCAVIAEGDDVAALEASLIENVARAPMDELSEYEAYARLLKQGRTVEQIAQVFAVTELRVKQRLALAGLQPKIKDAFRSGRIEADDLRLLTSATKGQQKEWLESFALEAQGDDDGDRDGEGAPRGFNLKRWLFGTDQIATKAARFPLDDFHGAIITDLFGDTGYFVDRDAFWRLQNLAVARLRDDLLAKGWQQVSIMERGRRFAEWQYREVTMEDGGRVFIEVRNDGEVDVHQGYRDRDEDESGEEEARTDEVGADEGDPAKQAVPAQAELTKAAENYMALHRHAIVRAELLSRPALALRLAVVHMIAGSPLWSVKPDPQRAEKEAIALSVASAKAQQCVEAERSAILELLQVERSHYGTLTRTYGDALWAAALLARLLTLPDETVLRVLTLAMAESLCAGSPLVEAAGARLKPDVVRWWTADDTFLDLVHDRAAINAMLAEVAGRESADANVSEAAKVQRKIIGDCVRGEGRDKVEGWVPRYMAFPASPYDGAKTVQAARHWEEVKFLFCIE
ncbi:ParB/RepB/Spo0J family partition protein [Bradyrhizobium prioriisuperbiae]|uniref:ParB/RepB/Spo0J family partition protein n=1 Tax=Bradyrhizobium prioriisuperbiae TaxID=2854389 RepID=UPI0028E1F187|nr:ParB/RepB/Spo0J family partition protein [Bradyrhizobium prioritasuperba]